MSEELLRHFIIDAIRRNCEYIVKFWLKHHSRTSLSFDFYGKCYDSIEQLLYSFNLQDTVNPAKIYNKIGNIYDENYEKSVWDHNKFASDFDDKEDKIAMQMIDMIGGNLYDWFTTYILQTSII